MANIEDHSIFGNYNKDENRVTDAFLQIVYAGGEKFVDHLLSYNDESLPKAEMLVETQFDSGTSIPDGKISCRHSYTIYIESKLDNSVREDQLKNHLDNLEKEKDNKHLLIYITIGPQRPDKLPNNVLWYSWENIYTIANEYDTENRLYEYLVAQFKKLLNSLNLIPKDYNQRVIIAAGGLSAEETALNYGYYACQADRKFQPANYITFLYQGKLRHLYRIIKGPVPRIKRRDIDEVKGVDESQYSADFLNQEVEYFSLSKIRDLDIEDDTTSKSGRHAAFVQKQRYTSFDSIIKAKRTSELIDFKE